ncbi:hypothetical protein QIH80_26370 [Bradyrhizobium elkanii]|nr:hypothetical protein QIH80_26370 [Bradyrhizobium elkanii]
MREAARADGDAETPIFRRSLSALQLVTLGIGGIIGAGIFVLTGHAAAANAGPAVTLSFMIGAVACAFAGLCYGRDVVDGADLRQRLHLCLCHARRTDRLDHRLGSDP